MLQLGIARKKNLSLQCWGTIFKVVRRGYPAADKRNFVKM